MLQKVLSSLQGHHLPPNIQLVDELSSFGLAMRLQFGTMTGRTRPGEQIKYGDQDVLTQAIILHLAGPLRRWDDRTATTILTTVPNVDITALHV